MVESYQYNKANWITGLTNKKDNTTLSSYTYTYYASGSQKSETTNTGVVTGYTYDDLGRLTRESEANGLTLAYTYDANGNRTQMTASGTDSYTTAYTYDANNRLTTEAKTQSGTTTTSVFTYDDNGNLLTELDATNTAVVTHSYDGFNRLISSVVGTTTITYSYNAQGIRTSRQVGDTYTQYLLDGGNVMGEVTDGTVTTYLRGANLISNGDSYYLYNAHGDVVQLTDSTGAVTKTYEYDAFGNEKNPSDTDTNPFRYCGEYYDTETGLYYLRARYYDPTVGRFTQEDTHWNTANMIYGDNPQKINEREDALGLKTYSHAPQISAIVQSGNLYVYCINNPVIFSDPTGNSIQLSSGVVSSLSAYLPVLVSGISASIASIAAGIASSWTLIGGIIGITVGVVALGTAIYYATDYVADAALAQAWTKAQVKAGGVDKNDLHGHSVYVIVKKGTNDVVYVGRTSSFDTRQYAHQLSSKGKFPVEMFLMMPVMTGLSLEAARALEQTLITGFTLEALSNAINSIAKSNYGKFRYEFERMQSLLSGYFDG